MPRTQTAASHAALDPITHFVLIPVFTVNVIASIVLAFNARHGLGLHLWLIVVSFALLLSVVKMRAYPLRVQDRVIRLEMRVRLERLLDSELRPRIGEFSLAQLISLRFASDVELPALARQVLEENLNDRKAIKRRIKDWQADVLRA